MVCLLGSRCRNGKDMVEMAIDFGRRLGRIRAAIAHHDRYADMFLSPFQNDEALPTIFHCANGFIFLVISNEMSETRLVTAS